MKLTRTVLASLGPSDSQLGFGPYSGLENDVHALLRGGRLDEASAAPRLGEAQAIRLSLGCS